jgi:small subunit ribosomal protein S1
VRIVGKSCSFHGFHNRIGVASHTLRGYNVLANLNSIGVTSHMDQNNALVGQEATPLNNQTQEEQAASNISMESLLEEEGLSLDLPKAGEFRTGVIAGITPGEILVSIGTKSEGVITGKEKEQIPAEDLASFQVGQEIEVFVVSPEDQHGNVVLSYLRAREESDWRQVDDLLASGDVYDSKIIGYNKGGLIVAVGNLRGFVPASQVSVLRRSESAGEQATPDQKWAKMVNQPIRVKVIEVDRERHRLILSERSALQETRETLKERLLEELHEGSVRTGRITSVADFGAFVNIDGADGLVHLSEISWDHINHPNEVLKVGQEVQVKVIAVDRERKRIGLSIRQTQSDPWLRKVAAIKDGQLIEGTITHLTKFGAFARLGEDLEGLIHISELSEERINHPKEVIKEGDVVTLRVIKIDAERRRIGLSLRKVDSPAYADADLKALAADLPAMTAMPADAQVEPEPEPEAVAEASEAAN